SGSKHEAAGNIAAVSPKNAGGLMQLMPGTARDVAAALGLLFSEARLTTNAGNNQHDGSDYLTNMGGCYYGHEAQPQDAYNAGPGKVDEWLKNHGDPRKGEIGTGAWVQKIPYAETRNYTRNILNDLSAAAPRPSEPRAQLVPVANPPQPALKSGVEPVA